MRLIAIWGLGKQFIVMKTDDQVYENTGMFQNFLPIIFTTTTQHY